MHVLFNINVCVFFKVAFEEGCTSMYGYSALGKITFFLSKN